MNKTTVIYHSADFDGIFCREIAKKFLPDAELIGWDFGDEALPFPSTEQIYVLDLPVDRVFGFEFKGQGMLLNGKKVGTIGDYKHIVWIDHHKTSIETHPKEIPGYRIDGVAACRLAWQWFNCTAPFDIPSAQWVPDENCLPIKSQFVERIVSEPIAVCLAGEYDIWDKRDPRSEMLQFGLRSRDITPFDWEQILSINARMSIKEIESLMDVGHTQNLIEPDGTSLPTILHGLLKDGELLQKYQQRNDSGTMHRSFMVEFEGLKFLALTAPRCNSLTFTSKDLKETGHDALMGFYYDGKQWKVSLYHASHNTSIDLSDIAKKYGGGGHRGACGFVIEKLPFLP